MKRKRSLIGLVGVPSLQASKQYSFCSTYEKKIPDPRVYDIHSPACMYITDTEYINKTGQERKKTHHQTKATDNHSVRSNNSRSRTDNDIDKTRARGEDYSYHLISYRIGAASAYLQCNRASTVSPVLRIMPSSVSGKRVVELRSDPDSDHFPLDLAPLDGMAWAWPHGMQMMDPIHRPYHRVIIYDGWGKDPIRPGGLISAGSASQSGQNVNRCRLSLLQARGPAHGTAAA